MQLPLLPEFKAMTFMAALYRKRAAVLDRRTKRDSRGKVLGGWHDTTMFRGKMLRVTNKTFPRRTIIRESRS